MAKRNSNAWNRDRVEVEEEEGAEVYNADTVLDFGLPDHTVQLVLCKNLKLNITGPATGNLYVFDGAGSVVDVDASDVEGMLLKKNNRSCCGAGVTPYFEVVGG